MGLPICHMPITWSRGAGFIKNNETVSKTEEACLRRFISCTNKLTCFLYMWCNHDLYVASKVTDVTDLQFKKKCFSHISNHIRMRFETVVKIGSCDFQLFRFATFDQIPIWYARKWDLNWQSEHSLRSWFTKKLYTHSQITSTNFYMQLEKLHLKLVHVIYKEMVWIMLCTKYTEKEKKNLD